MPFNLSATLNVLRLFWEPTLVKPTLVLNDFNSLGNYLIPGTIIKAVVVDKDNCFALAYDDKVWHAYVDKWDQLRRQYPGDSLLIVSNSAGTNDDISYKEAKILEERTGVKVLRHSTKKPGCHKEIIHFFKSKGVISNSNEVAVIGDRLFTDVLMANMMGSHGIWLREGVKLSMSPICRFERWLYDTFFKAKST